MRAALASFTLCAFSTLGCAASAPRPAPPAAVTTGTAASRRTEYAQQLLRVIGRASPEQIGYLGLPGFDDAVLDVSLAADERDSADLLAAAGRFAEQRRTEPEPDAQTDLAILEDAARRFAERTRLTMRLSVRVPDVARELYQGLGPLLRSGSTPSQRASAVHRVRLYLGEGMPPLVDASIARVRADIAAHKLAPTRPEIQVLLTNLPPLRAAIMELIARSALPRGNEVGSALDRYRQFLEAEVLPAAREDFRLPREIYAMNLRDLGIDEAPETLAARARTAFDRTMLEWRSLAREIAVERRLTDPSPTAVLAILKREQRTGPALQALFEQRIVDVESVTRRERLVTLPARPLLFRASSAAETAMNPSPTIDVQGFLNGSHEIAILMPGAPAPDSPPYDDFTYDSAVWPLLVHEGRPGHELQFTTAVARGLSTARTLFAFNSANVEGWAVYCEEIMRPFMPREGRFVALQYLLIREARAFLDPGLQLGTLRVADVDRVLRGELGVSSALNDSETKRYTFQSPGQATAYFVGLEKLEQLRREVQEALGPRFDAQRFHDAVLHQGFVPLGILARGVKQELGVIAGAS